MKIALAQINPIIGDLEFNRKKILHFIQEAKKKKADVVVFPEMALLGYPPEDLLNLPQFIEAVNHSLQTLIPEIRGIAAIVGTIRKNPERYEKNLFNTAALIDDGKLVGFQDKSLLPTYDVFSERRYFEPATTHNLWEIGGKKIGITICEDIWQHSEAAEYTHYAKDPVLLLQQQHPDIVINISASPYYFTRRKTRLHVAEKVVQTLHVPLVFCNQVGGNDSLIFDGCSFYLNEKGQPLLLLKSFEEDLQVIDTEEQRQSLPFAEDGFAELFQALVLGTRDYFHKLGFKKALLGLSGGIDSAVVACIAATALSKENVSALLLPSRYSSKESYEDAIALAAHLGIDVQEVSIEKPFQSFLDLLQPTNELTEENLQSRIRGMILMAFSNQTGALVLNTGNKSEMALGYSTLYGDMCGALGVLGDVSKQLVYKLAHWINREKEVIPKRILEKEPSAELKYNQKDSDTMPPYEILDTVLHMYVEGQLSPEEIARKNDIELSLVKEIVKKIHLNEYKRRQAPPALRVTRKAFFVGRHFPIVQKWNV